MSKNIYEIVTNQIIAKLEEGVIPWKKSWNEQGSSVNWVTGKEYRGINTMLLAPGEYATFKQIQEAGGKIKKGEKAQLVVLWKPFEKEDKDTGEKTTSFVLRYYNVFEINTQVEGLESKRVSKTIDFNPIEKAEEIVKGYKDIPKMTTSPKGAFYVPAKDYVNMPPQEHFHSSEEYYSTLFHELVHSTGHTSRLNRDGITEVAAFGSDVYSKEELVAEIGSAMICATAGIDNSTMDNSASYIQSWLTVLKGDNKLIVSAAQQSQKAVDYILGTEFEEK